MTNFDKIKSLNIDQFAEWLDSNGMWDNSPWSKWFDEEYCKKCESVKAMVQNFGFERECKFAWCELEHKCKFFQSLPEEPSPKDVIKLWLEAEAEDEEV